jgi:hypothetical protein
MRATFASGATSVISGLEYTAFHFQSEGTVTSGAHIVEVERSFYCVGEGLVHSRLVQIFVHIAYEIRSQGSHGNMMVRADGPTLGLRHLLLWFNVSK